MKHNLFGKSLDEQILQHLFDHAQQHAGEPEISLSELLSNLGVQKDSLVLCMVRLREKKWIEYDLTEQATSGLVWLTSAGYKVAKGISPQIEKSPNFSKTILQPSILNQAIPEPAYDYTQAKWHNPQWPDIQEEKYEAFREIFQPSILLMSATETELRQVIRLLELHAETEKIRKIHKRQQTYYAEKFGAFDTVVVKCDMGSGGTAGSSFTASDAIKDWKPKALIMVGIAFAVDRDKHQPADVLIAERIIPYEKQRVGVDAIFRDAIPPTGIILLNRFKNAFSWSFQRPDGTQVKCHSGAILSGEKLIDDPAFKKELFDQYPHEMEGAGIYAAAFRSRIEWILVKGVSDWADGQKHDDYQEMAAAAAASLAHFVLSSSTALDGL